MTARGVATTGRCKRCSVTIFVRSQVAQRDVRWYGCNNNKYFTARFNEGPVKNGGRRVIFVSGDHPEPTAFIKQLIESFGFAAIDLGGLATGGRLQQAGGPLAGRDLVEFGGH
jgi:predicted dinucleotide-binding enzyme